MVLVASCAAHATPPADLAESAPTTVTAITPPRLSPGTLAGLGPDVGPVVAGTDLGHREVPLEQIVFDTFGAGDLTRAEADDPTGTELRDAIIPPTEPRYVSIAEAAPDLSDDDLVLGFVAADGSAWAHPHRILDFHEIVKAELGGQPIVVTFCSLCRSGTVYSR